MSDLTLAEIAARFACLDDVDDADHAAYEKALRNLVQRHFLPPTTQQGRVFLYDRAAAVTIRLAQIAAEFGLPRASIDTLSRWLSNSGERRVKVEGGYMGVSRAAEAIERVESGESFSIHVVMRADGSVRAEADWASDSPRSPRAADAIRAARGEPMPEVARFTLPASRLIAEILPLMSKD